MATPKTFQEVYSLWRDNIQGPNRPDADFVEGSWNDLLAGSAAMAYQDSQREILDLFAKTWFSSARGQDLEDLATDHFYEGAARPSATKAVGAITITRQTGNNNAINVAVGDDFTTKGKVFKATQALTILAGNASGEVFLEAEEGGPDGNIPANSEWTSDIENVDISNGSAFQGGLSSLNDENYREFIQNFVRSVQNGTVNGIEGAALITPGISSAKVVKVLVEVGTLNAAKTALADSPNLFKTIQTTLYVATLEGQANSALVDKVKNNIKSQKSVEDYIDVKSAREVNIDWTATLTFASTPQALALSKKRADIVTAFEQAINSLGIGDDFDRTAMATRVLSQNAWQGLFSVETTVPSGDVSVGRAEKAVSGNIVVSLV